MRRFALGLLLISGTALAAEPAASVPPAGVPAPGARNRVTGALCDPWRSVPVNSATRPHARKLGELPPGNVVLSVVREVDGCLEPVIVRYGVGNSAVPARTNKSRR